MSTIIIITPPPTKPSANGFVEPVSAAEMPDGSGVILDESGTLLAKFKDYDAAIEYLQHMAAHGLSVELSR